MNDISVITDQLRAVNPSVKIVLTQLTPSSASPPTFGACGSKLPIFNRNLATFAPAKSTEQSPIVVVNPYRGFDPVAMSNDGIDPNQYGQQLMADRYHVALQTLLATGQPTKRPLSGPGNAAFDDHLAG